MFGEDLDILSDSPVSNPGCSNQSSDNTFHSDPEDSSHSEPPALQCTFSEAISHPTVDSVCAIARPPVFTAALS
jgi:hypothetical protein